MCVRGIEMNAILIVVLRGKNEKVFVILVEVLIIASVLRRGAVEPLSGRPEK